MSRALIGLPGALAVSVLVHLGVLHTELVPTFQALAPPSEALEMRVELPPPPPPLPRLLKTRKAAPQAAAPLPAADTQAEPASMAAPPPPSAEEWRLAATYTLKNSKRYRHAWGQQVRSQMGTAVAGSDQGLVRFRITINPDGSVARVEEIWSTSEQASKLAWQAIRKLPPLPPTPTGKPLVFEQTISFVPFETGWPPSYKNDCLPEPPSFRNPFAWDGRGQPPAQPDHPAGEAAPMKAASQVECDPTSTADSIEEEEQELARQMNKQRWGR